jgi:DNA-binding transcriptional ArsR family regulator
MSQDEITLTADNLKALAHPLRVRILGLLRTYGPATATTLAGRLDLSSGALSYHLRQLERFGFIVEDTERGDQRDRWWKAAHRRTLYSALPSEHGGAQSAEGDVYEDSVAAAAMSGLARARAARSRMPAPWQRTINMSDYLLQLTVDEAMALGDDLERLLSSYRQHDPESASVADARLITAQFQIFPVPGPEEVEESE